MDSRLDCIRFTTTYAKWSFIIQPYLLCTKLKGSPSPTFEIGERVAPLFLHSVSFPTSLGQRLCPARNRATMVVRVIHLILFMVVVVSVRAQIATIAGGGSTASSVGFISVSVGQTVDHYAVDGNYYNGWGVQQPYCITRLDTVFASVCQHQYYTDGSFSIPSDSTSIAGIRFFTHRLVAYDGCDSLVTLALTIHPVSAVDTVAIACDELQWHGDLLVSSGTYTHRALSGYGCDSTTTLHLTLRHSSVSITQEQAFQRYTWRGRTLTQSGIYRDTLIGANAEGCDSVLELSLALIDVPIPVIYCYSRRLILVDHYPGGEGSRRVDYRTYRWYHNGTLVPLATADKFYTLAGNQYLELDGCYYVEVPADASARFWVRSNVLCITGDDVGIRTPSLIVYPNPASSQGALTVIISDCLPESTLLIHDAYGRQLYSASASDGRCVIPVGIAAGTYTVSLRSSQGEIISRKLVVR